MTKLNDKVVAVTGAGSGIGRALAQALVAKGAHVAISDVNEVGLKETTGLLGTSTKVTSHVVDVRSREQVEAFADAVRKEHGGADAIINNAGVTARVSIEDCSYEDMDFILGVNLWGVIYGTKAFFPLFRERGAGHIVNISSINAFVPFPHNGPYNISKYAVHGLNETLMQELVGDAIRITSVHPGGVQTNIANSAKYTSPKQAAMFNRVAKTTSDQAAQEILNAVEKNKQRVFVGLDAKLMQAAKRAAPATVVNAVATSTRRMWDKASR